MRSFRLLILLIPGAVVPADHVAAHLVHCPACRHLLKPVVHAILPVADLVHCLACRHRLKPLVHAILPAADLVHSQCCAVVPVDDLAAHLVDCLVRGLQSLVRALLPVADLVHFPSY